MTDAAFTDIESPEAERCNRCGRTIPAGEPHAGIQAQEGICVTLCCECWNYLCDLLGK